MRVHELAKELKISSPELIERLEALNVKVKNHMAALDDSVVEKLRKKIEKPKPKEGKPKKAPVAKVAPAVKEKKQKVKPIEIKVEKKVKVEKEVKIEKEVKTEKETRIEKEVKPENPKPKPIVYEVFYPKKEFKTFPTSRGKTPRPKVEEVGVEKAPSLPQPVEAVTASEIQVKFPVNVKELAFKLQRKPSDIIKKLMELRIFANINQAISEDVAGKIVQSFGCKLTKLPTEEEAVIALHTKQDDKALLKSRPPVVTFMGHVDHGKTSLLDAIRKSKVAEEEHGGITQHIGAYKVLLNKGQITFLDTPGHEAFTAMRARGANITDIVVLVVAADEGIMPQTVEAIDHAKAAGVPILVAMNKIDKSQADVDRVKKQLAELDLNPEDWGGKTITVGVSAKTGEGIDTLLEMMLLEAEMLELKANYDKPASGVVVEARLTKGKGPIATVIVQNGTLRPGDVIIVGSQYGKIRALLDDRERSVQAAGPAIPVEILGLSGVPQAGEQFYVVDDEKKAKEICSKRQDSERQKQMAPVARISLDDLYAKIKEGQIKELNIILKADVQGSLEALQDSLKKLSTDEVKLNVIHSGIGAVNTSDVILAVASAAVIIGFHIDTAPEAQAQIEKEGVDVRMYRIIYDAINEVKAALEGLLEPKLKKKFLGSVEIRTVFKLSKYGIIAGCFVQKGKINRQAEVSLIRNGEVVYEGKVASLKRFKDDVREVAEGFECGIGLSNYDDIKQGDIIEAFEIEKIARKL